MLGFFIVYLNGMRIIMFQLSGFYCRRMGPWVGLEASDAVQDLEFEMQPVLCDEPLRPQVLLLPKP